MKANVAIITVHSEACQECRHGDQVDGCEDFQSDIDWDACQVFCTEFESADTANALSNLTEGERDVYGVLKSIAAEQKLVPLHEITWCFQIRVLSKSNSWIHCRLKRLIDQGLVKRVSRGVYALED